MSSIDQSRIQGFGSDCSSHVWSCPAGHLLMRTWARTGKCDRCYRHIMEGETVMDCRRCDWYICKNCHPPAWHEDEDDSIWGTFSMIVGAASREVARGATEVEAFVSDMADQLNDVTTRMTCQPTSRTAVLDEEAEILAFTEQQAWSDGEDSDAGRSSAAEEHRTPSCRTTKVASKPPPVAVAVSAAGVEVGGCGEEPDPAPAALPREPTDLIDLGHESLLDAAPVAPGYAASQQPFVDLLDLPGSLPKDKTPPVSASNSTHQPTLMFSQLGA